MPSKTFSAITDTVINLNGVTNVGFTTSNNRIIIPEDGVYILTATAYSNNASSIRTDLAFTLNGTSATNNWLGGQSLKQEYCKFSLCNIVSLSSGDQVALLCSTANDVTLNKIYFSILKVG